MVKLASGKVQRYWGKMETGTSKTGPYNNRNADQCLHGGQHIHCAITIADLCLCVTFQYKCSLV